MYTFRRFEGFLILSSSSVSPQIVTVNCARLIKTDQHSTNGIVHVVDRVITAISNTVHSIIDVDENLETLRVSTSVSQFKMNKSQSSHISSVRSSVVALKLSSLLPQTFTSSQI